MVLSLRQFTTLQIEARLSGPQIISPQWVCLRGDGGPRQVDLWTLGIAIPL